MGVGALTRENCGLFGDYFLCVVPQDADVVHSECEELLARDFTRYDEEYGLSYYSV